MSIDPQIRLKVPEDLRHLVNDEKELLGVDDVQELRKSWRSENHDDIHFHEFLLRCEMILPEPKLAPRNPELEARVQKLKEEQSKREYERMTNNVDSSRFNSTDRDEKPISKQRMLSF